MTITIRNFYEELKDTMSYAEMPKAAAQEVRNIIIKRAEDRNVPAANLEKIRQMLDTYEQAVIANSANKSRMLKSFAEVYGYAAAGDNSTLREALSMINTEIQIYEANKK